MAKRKSAGESSDREQKWDKVFNALVKLSQNLHKDRNVLEDRIKYLLDEIYKLKMEQKVKFTGAEFFLSFKEREALNYKHRYEDVDDELADFKESFDYLLHQCSEPKDISNDTSCKGHKQKNKALREEVRRVKTEFEKFKSEKISEISALLAGKTFLWNQYKNMESQLDTKFRKKCDEADHANEMVQVMINRADELQLSNEKLRTDFSMMEFELSQKNQEISRLSKEIVVLKSSSQSARPILHKCTAGSRATDMGAKTSNDNVRGAATVKQESDYALAFEKMTRTKPAAHKSTGGKAPKQQVNAKMTRTKPAAHKSTGGKAPRKQLNAKVSSSSKSNEVNIITIPDSPKLFTSSFIVPKLKSSQSPQVVMNTFGSPAW